jgi:HD-like signal output (HDOD) protein
MATATWTPAPAVHNRILAIEALHSCPAVVLRILELLKDPEFDTQEVAAQLEKDPALSAAILKLVNSSWFGFTREIGSLRHAITCLGARSLQLVVLGFGLVDRLAKGAPAKVYHDYWRRALTIASAASRLCGRGDGARPDEAYTAGLLADVGALALAQIETDRYTPLYERQGHGRTLAAEEASQFGVDHAALGGHLLRRWNLPRPLVDAVTSHHHDHPAADRLSRLVFAGDMMADALWTPQSPRMAETQQFLQTDFHLDLDGFISFALGCKKDILDSAAAFRVDLQGTIDCDAIRESAARQYKQAALECAADMDSLIAVVEQDCG